jgi:hypothetical protein
MTCTFNEPPEMLTVPDAFNKIVEAPIMAPFKETFVNTMLPFTMTGAVKLMKTLETVRFPCTTHIVPFLHCISGRGGVIPKQPTVGAGVEVGTSVGDKEGTGEADVVGLGDGAPVGVGELLGLAVEVTEGEGVGDTAVGDGLLVGVGSGITVTASL